MAKKHPFNILSVKALNNYLNGIMPETDEYSYSNSYGGVIIDAYQNGDHAGDLVICTDENNRLFEITYTKSNEKGWEEQYCVEFDGQNILKMKLNGEVLTSEERISHIPDFYAPIIPAIDITNEEIRNALKNGEEIASEFLRGIDYTDCIEIYSGEETNTRKNYEYRIIDKDETVKIRKYERSDRLSGESTVTQTIGDLVFSICEYNYDRKRNLKGRRLLGKYEAELGFFIAPTTKFMINNIEVTEEVFKSVYHSHKRMVEESLLRYRSRSSLAISI